MTVTVLPSARGRKPGGGCIAEHLLNVRGDLTACGRRTRSCLCRISGCAIPIIAKR